MFINQILTKLKSLVYSKSETDSLLNGKASSSHTHNSTYLGISAKAESAKVADYAKLLAYSHTSEINFMGGRQPTCYFNYRNADDDSTGTAATVEYKFCNYGGNSWSNVTVTAGTFKANNSSSEGLLLGSYRVYVG